MGVLIVGETAELPASAIELEAAGFEVERRVDGPRPVDGTQEIAEIAGALRLERLRRSESDIEDVPSDRLRAIVERFTATDSYRELAACEAVIICVPTPLANHREPDLSYLVDAATQLSRVLHEGRLVVLESTTYPGTTRERLLPMLEESGLAAGREFILDYSPVRIDPGRSDHEI